jgi:hypothetical protein
LSIPIRETDEHIIGVPSARKRGRPNKAIDVNERLSRPRQDHFWSRLDDHFERVDDILLEGHEVIKASIDLLSKLNGLLEAERQPGETLLQCIMRVCQERKNLREENIQLRETLRRR